MKPLVDKAQELASLAKKGEMVLFLGAGVSVGAGLPMWSDLLTALAKVKRSGGKKNMKRTEDRWSRESKIAN